MSALKAMPNWFPSKKKKKNQNYEPLKIMLFTGIHHIQKLFKMKIHELMHCAEGRLSHAIEKRAEKK